MESTCFRRVFPLARVTAFVLLGITVGCDGADPETHASCASGGCAEPDGGSACACVPRPPDGWSDPVLLWTGEEDDAPLCPAFSPRLGFEAGIDVVTAPLECPTCECDLPAPTCALSSSWTATDGACGEGHISWPLEASDAWDGSCLGTGHVQGNALCDGHYCVQSMTIDTPALTTGGCAPAAVETPAVPEARFGTYVRACAGQELAACASAEETCVAPPPPEFLECIFAVGENECPDTWPDQHVVFERIDDSRGCSPCACGDVEGASCAVQASVFSDGACPQVVFSAVISSDLAEDLCMAVTPGAPLGSKSASVVSLEPGACKPSGGEPVGAAEPSKPATFCCRP